MRLSSTRSAPPAMSSSRAMRRVEPHAQVARVVTGKGSKSSISSLIRQVESESSGKLGINDSGGRRNYAGGNDGGSGGVGREELTYGDVWVGREDVIFEGSVSAENSSQTGSLGRESRVGKSSSGNEGSMVRTGRGKVGANDEEESGAEKKDRRKVGGGSVVRGVQSLVQSGLMRSRHGGLLSGGLFGKGGSKLVMWPVGVEPRVVYAWESRGEMADGHGGGGLRGTLLCKMGAGYRAWDVVRGGESVCVRIVGWYWGGGCGGGGDVERIGIYSVVDGVKVGVHDECEGGSVVRGYHYVSEGRGVAVGRVVEEGSLLMLKVGLRWVGGEVGGEVKWKVAEKGTEMRGGGAVLRFGYYFFLDEPCGVRLFTNTDTPEHVRLVARRTGDGTVDEETSRGLTYIIVRVGGD